MRCLFTCAAAALLAASAGAAVRSQTRKGVETHDLDSEIFGGDVLAGALGIPQPGDLGWNPLNTDPLDQLAAITDGVGMRPTHLTGMLADNPPPGQPTKRLRYDIPPTDVAELRWISGNIIASGRCFNTAVVRYSTDFGANFSTLGYFQSDPSGTLNNYEAVPRFYVIMQRVYDDTSPTLLAGVTSLIFDFYAVGDEQGEMRDPFDGVNPFTGLDDQLPAAHLSPLLWEIDVIAVPEPGTLLLLALLGLLRRR